MKAQGGTIAYTGSPAGFFGLPKSGPYSAAKAAGRILLDTCRIELKDTKIKLVALYPGFVRTPMADAFDQVFASEPVDLAEFDANTVLAIEAGEVLPGMTRKAVLAALGPPPRNGTASLSSPAWKYWHEDQKPFFVRFDAAGRVLEAH